MTAARSSAAFAIAIALAWGACVTPARASGATTDVDVSRVTLKLPHGVPPVAFTYPVVSAASAASAATLKD